MHRRMLKPKPGAKFSGFSAFVTSPLCLLLILVIFLIILIFISGNTEAAFVQLNASNNGLTDDSGVDRDSPLSVVPPSLQWSVGSAANRETWLKFNLSLIPASATITEALLGARLKSEWVTAGNSFWARAQNGTALNWNESTIAWNNKPVYDDFWESQVEIVDGRAVDTWSIWNVTNITKGNYGLGYKNMTIVLITNLSTGNPDWEGINVWSKEDSITSAAYINVTYTVSSDSCSCPGSGDWSITNGDICTLSSACQLGTNKLRINNGTLRIGVGGAVRSGGCYVASISGLFVQDGGGLYCSG